MNKKWLLGSVSISDIADPAAYSMAVAEKLARQLMAEGESLPERFALALQTEPPPDDVQAERMLELLSRITPPARLLPLLNLIMPQSNLRIRSKAWKLYAAVSADLTWALAQLTDENARVAANVVEALWRVKPSPQLNEIFRLAAKQERNRVAGNGLVGLINCQDPAAIAHAERLARHQDAAFRVTVAWAIGQALWPLGMELLRELQGDKSESVRVKAEESLKRIQNRYPKTSLNK